MDLILLELMYYTGYSAHILRLHAQPTEDVPSLPGGDFLYTQTNAGPGAETHLLQTLDAVGTLWAAYYTAGWSLALANVWGRTAGLWTPFLTRPTYGPISGALAGTSLTGSPTARRVFTLTSSGSYRRRMWLRQIPTATVAPRLEVTPTTGGYDARDQQLLAYLSGTVTALLAPDGTPFDAQASVRTWWDRPYA